MRCATLSRNLDPAESETLDFPQGLAGTGRSIQSHPPSAKSVTALKVLSLFGRSERIRTSDPIVPNDVRYQAALHSDMAGPYKASGLAL
jgi:hypothetical protein